MFKKMQKYVLTGLAIATLFATAACSNTASTGVDVNAQALANPALEADAKQPIADQYAVFHTNKGDFTVRLYGSKAPITVKNFDYLVEHGFYDKLTFHRVIKDFMIQGGDPIGNGTGGPGYEIPDEFVNDLHFDKAGILAMANSGPNTGGSQFFITVAPTPWLDNHHTIFGVVVKGLDIVEKISEVKTDRYDRPVDPVVIESINIEPVK